MGLLFLLIISVFASNEKENTAENSEQNSLENSILVKIEADEYNKSNSSHYIGVCYIKFRATWRSYRWSKNENKAVYNGANYKDEETAARASDTLARKLIANGEKGHKLNFPDDDTEVYPEKCSKYFGVTYNKQRETWFAWRYGKSKSKTVYNGTYKNEETAARASDTLARQFIANGENGHKLNFPDDYTEVYSEEKTSQYIGVSYYKKNEIWRAGRWSKRESKPVHNGSYKDEETAAHASDTLARKLIANGEQNHKLNFPDDNTEVYAKENETNKRKRPADFKDYQKCGKSFDKY